MAYGFLHGIEALGGRLDQDWRAAAPQPEWKIVHFFGYDNSFYHSVLYPVLYRLAFPQWSPDIDYLLNEFYLLDGEKFSTSRRHAIWGKEILGPHSVDAVRFHLCRTRPEGRRTNFRLADYEATLRDTLVGTWQQWLNDLGHRVAERHGGRAPDPGTWTAEHRAFLRRLEARRSAVADSLGPDGFSLNRAARELDGIVEEALRFSRDASLVATVPEWTDEAATATALELAAARLLAGCAGPVMPRFAAGLAAALGQPSPDRWPAEVTLVPPGSRIDLAGRVFFGAEPADTEAANAPSMLAWLRDVVRTTLQLPDDEAVDARPLPDLGMESLHAVALQYQVLEETGVDISIDDLFAARDVAALAELLGQRSTGRPVPEGVPG